MAAPGPKATVQDGRFVRRMLHRVRSRLSRRPNQRRDVASLGVGSATKKTRTACHMHTMGTQAVFGAGRNVVVPKLVDEAEHFTEVTALATANSSQSLLEDADNDVVDPAAASLVGMERAEALSLWTFSQPSTIGSECVCYCFKAVCFHLSEPCHLTFDVQVACPLCPWRTVIRNGRQLEQHLEGDHAASLFLVASGKKTAVDGHVLLRGRYVYGPPSRADLWRTSSTLAGSLNIYRGNCY